MHKSYILCQTEMIWLFLPLIGVATAIVVDSNLGSIQGYPFKTRNSREVFLFAGIPYATPPLGDLRFLVSIIMYFQSLILILVTFCKLTSFQKSYVQVMNEYVFLLNSFSNFRIHYHQSRGMVH